MKKMLFERIKRLVEEKNNAIFKKKERKKKEIKN